MYLWETTLDKFWEDAKAVVNETGQATVPKQRRRKFPWASKEVFNMFEFVDQRRKVKASGMDSQEASKYRELSRKIQHQARHDKNSYISKKCAEIERKSEVNNTRDIFKNIKSLENLHPNSMSWRMKMGRRRYKDKVERISWKAICV